MSQQQGAAKQLGPKYRWEPVAKSDSLALFLDERQIGVYDPKTQVYRKIMANGKLSEPAVPPWGETKSATVTAAAPSKEKEAVQVMEETQSMSWSSYGVGGGVTGCLLLVFGLMRRN